METTQQYHERTIRYYRRWGPRVFFSYWDFNFVPNTDTDVEEVQVIVNNLIALRDSLLPVSAEYYDGFAARYIILGLQGWIDNLRDRWDELEIDEDYIEHSFTQGELDAQGYE